MSNTTSKKSTKEILANRIQEIKAKNIHKTLASQQSEQHLQKSHLSPKRHNTPDFFVIDVFDASLKDDLASMEHPLFAMKTGDTRVREYEHNGNTLRVEPSARGCATIHDKDVWIYCISALMAAQNRGQEIDRIVRFTAYDFLVSTNRQTSGKYYKALKEALYRLAGTRIITNIKTGAYRLESNFGLLDKIDILYLNPEDENSPMIGIEVTLPDWLYRSIQHKQVKTISPDYFRLRKPLDRRIYELCAKHCGAQFEWSISLELLHKKTGSTAPLRNFRIAVRSLVASNEVPDYSLKFDEANDMLKVTNRNVKSVLRKIK